MRLIEREMVLLHPPDDAELDRTYRGSRRCTRTHSGGTRRTSSGLERLGATRMRQYVRAWINEWDLLRLDPGFRPQTEVAPVVFSYAEQPDLDGGGTQD